MSTRTRYFVIASLLLLSVGVGTALVAYSVGFQMSARGRSGPDELKYVPRDATVVAYADVRDVMVSQFRQKLHEVVPNTENGQREFENETGINIETDIDRVVAFASPGNGPDFVPPGNGLNTLPSGGGMLLARGRFDEGKIEALMREHGARIEDYNGKRLIVADVKDAVRRLSEVAPDTRPAETPPGSGSFGVAFLEPGLVAVGSARLLRSAVDLQKGGQNVTTNEELMAVVRTVESGNAWAVGRFDALQAQAKLPASVASQLPPITWFSVSSQVNGGIHGVIRAETRDDESANNLRDVVRGFVALARLQAGSKPEYQGLMQSLEPGGTGKTVELSFAIPVEIFDVIGKLTKPGAKPAKPMNH